TRSCNNIANLKNIPLEAAALKTRCINEIDREEAKLAPAPANTDSSKEIPSAPVVPKKKRKTISMKSLSVERAWEIETADDVDRYISSLKAKLLDNIEENTIVRIEL
ncbi:MAG: hypothetical protein NC340_10555, partial [Ruminococcus flavefaciens]|nr:hypothetical protein [Ruminococcus flavefaciens]